jgi:methylmalonyl-CoA/ethylmalonyl-CoA epimerase
MIPELATIPELAILGPHATFHHVGVAVESIRRVVNDPSLNVVTDEVQQVSVAFVEMGGVTVELIEPLGDASPIALSLQKGQRLVHLCFEVADLEAAIAAGRTSGLHRIATPVPAAAFGNRRIAWLFSRHFGLIELVEQ